MERSSFFNAQMQGNSYDRVYLAEDFARYFASFIGNGVFPTPSSNLQVVAINSNMTIKIKIGKAWINGYFYENTEDLTHVIEVADGLLNRIDLVVLRLDFNNREIKSYVKKGAFATEPKVPELIRNSDMYEIALASVRINRGIIGINQSDITDLRQYQDSFNTWFNSIKGQLGTDLAGNLQLQLNNKLEICIAETLPAISQRKQNTIYCKITDKVNSGTGGNVTIRVSPNLGIKV